MERKEFSIKEIDERGTGRAVISTFDVVDKDGDVVKPGAFGTQHVKLIPAHDWKHVPIGKAVISEQGDTAVADFRINLDIPSAREWYEALKFDMANGPPLQEWSYGFRILKKSDEVVNGRAVRVLERLKVDEVSPVLVGAGEGTRTVAVKSDEKAAVASHKTPTVDTAWNGPQNEARVKSDEGAGYYRRIYAWRDPSGDVGAKSSWKFIHHMVGTDGTPGAANVRACITGIAVLNGARGGTTIPDADKQGVYNHLAKHLRDADREPPELRSADMDGMKFAEQLAYAVGVVQDAMDRARAIQMLRESEGRDLSDDRKAQIAELEAAFAALRGLDAPDPVATLVAEYERTRAKVRRLTSVR